MIANLIFLFSLTKTHNLNGDVYKISSVTTQKTTNRPQPN